MIVYHSSSNINQAANSRHSTVAVLCDCVKLLDGSKFSRSEVVVGLILVCCAVNKILCLMYTTFYSRASLPKRLS